MEKAKKHFCILLGIYIVILVWGILLKANKPSIINGNFQVMAKLNFFERFTYALNPFSMKATTKNLNFLNFFAFIPFGFLIGAISEKRLFLRSIGLSLLLSLVFEISQIFTAIGGFATNDLLFNTLGGAVGFVVFAIFNWLRKQFSQEAQEKMTMAVVAICYMAFVPLALYGIGKTVYHIDFYLSLVEPIIRSWQ